MAETASFMQGQKIDKSNPGGGLATGGKDDGGPLESLNQKIGSAEPLFYPVDIQAIDHYMIFSAYKEHTFQGSLESTKRTNFQKEGSVFLPMPSNLQTGYQQVYKEEAVGALGMALGAQAKGVIEDAGAGKGAGGKIGEGLASIGRRGAISSIYFDGEIHSLRAYGSVFSASQIFKDYTNTKSKFFSGV